MSQPTMIVPDMCRMHQLLLVRQVGFGPEDPWRALIVMAQVALLQGATADPACHKRIGGDLLRLSEIGCLACFKPDCFGEIVQAAQTGEIGAIKRLGESWVRRADEAADTKDHETPAGS